MRSTLTINFSTSILFHSISYMIDSGRLVRLLSLWTRFGLNTVARFRASILFSIEYEASFSKISHNFNMNLKSSKCVSFNWNYLSRLPSVSCVEERISILLIPFLPGAPLLSAQLQQLLLDRLCVQNRRVMQIKIFSPLG